MCLTYPETKRLCPTIKPYKLNRLSWARCVQFSLDSVGLEHDQCYRVNSAADGNSGMASFSNDGEACRRWWLGVTPCVEFWGIFDRDLPGVGGPLKWWIGVGGTRRATAIYSNLASDLFIFIPNSMAYI